MLRWNVLYCKSCVFKENDVMKELYCVWNTHIMSHIIETGLRFSSLFYFVKCTLVFFQRRSSFFHWLRIFIHYMYCTRISKQGLFLCKFNLHGFDSSKMQEPYCKKNYEEIPFLQTTVLISNKNFLDCVYTILAQFENDEQFDG